jgi:hypothetical protein
VVTRPLSPTATPQISPARSTTWDQPARRSRPADGPELLDEHAGRKLKALGRVCRVSAVIIEGNGCPRALPAQSF